MHQLTLKKYRNTRMANQALFYLLNDNSVITMLMLNSHANLKRRANLLQKCVLATALTLLISKKRQTIIHTI